MKEYFPKVSHIPYKGADSADPLSYHYYDPTKKVLGKTMQEHLRIAVCYWHTFCFLGLDMFGHSTFDRPWERSDDPLKNAEQKADAAFELFEKLKVPFFCFHDRDIAPEGKTLQESNRNVWHIANILAEKMQKSKIGLLWGTANLFSNKRYMGGAATNPDPDVFAYAVAQTKNVLDVTHHLQGKNYVFWGGREGYETILNTDMKKELDQLAAFFTLICDYKHKIGFKGAFLIEPKPCEPTKHQYDFDCATVFAFLQKYGLEKEFKVNIEANHATLAGHSFMHEVDYALSNNIFGSIDANQGDPQLGWDTDLFPMNLQDMSYVMYLVMQKGGFQTGGFNFDSKVRRQSVDLIDLFYGHIAGIDTLARSLLIAEKMIQKDVLKDLLEKRYKKWQSKMGAKMLKREVDVQAISKYVLDENIEPTPISGRQELLDGYLNNFIR